jgi:hypothetical protein
VADRNHRPLDDAAEPFPIGKPGEAVFEIRKTLAGRGQLIDSGELAKNLLDVWGGPRRLAEDIFREYTKAPNGSVARQRNLEMVMRLIVTNTTHDIVRPVNPEDLSDGDLATVAEHYLGRIRGDELHPAIEGPRDGTQEGAGGPTKEPDNEFSWFDPDHPE